MVVIPSISGRLRGIINITDDGLMYRTTKSSTFYPWEKITNIFTWRKFNVLTIIDENLNISSGFIFADRKHGRPLEKIDYISKTWEEKIKQNQKNVYFEYPDWCSEKERQLYLENIFWGLAGGALIIAVGFAAFVEEGSGPFSIKDDWPIIAGFLVGSYGLVLGLANLIERRHKKISEILPGENHLDVIYEDGSQKRFDLESVRKHNLMKRRYKGTIVFEGGLKLEHLERISYWPILREYLLSRLEP